MIEASPLTSCCFCFNLKAGCFMIGILGLTASISILMSLYLAIWGPAELHHTISQDYLILDWFLLSSLAGGSLIYAFFCCFLLTGLTKSCPKLLNTWMVCQMCFTLIHILLTILICIVISRYLLAIIFINSILTSIFFHSYSVVREYRATLKKETEDPETDLKIQRGNHYSMRHLIKETNF